MLIPLNVVCLLCKQRKKRELQGVIPSADFLLESLAAPVPLSTAFDEKMIMCPSERK